MKLLFLIFPAFAFASAKIEVHAHRGARGAFPENTLPAFAFALERGAEVLELDIAITRDGVPVISHEPDITPQLCLDTKGNKIKEPIIIHNLTYEEVKTYDCGSLPNERFPEQKRVPQTPIPKLEELFELVQKSQLPAAKKIQFNIETKIVPAFPDVTPAPKEFAEIIIKLVRKHGLTSRVILQSFDDRTLLAAKKIEPKLRTSILTSDNHLDYVAIARAAKVNIVSPDHNWILEEDVRRLHQAGFKVIPWTANDIKSWERLLRLGVDGIITDYPHKLIDYLSTKP